MFSVVIEGNLHLLNSDFYVVIQMSQYNLRLWIPDMEVEDKQVICEVYRLWLFACGK